MAKCIGLLIIFSFFLIFVNSKPAKRKNRGSDVVNFVERIEETISEERNETLETVLTKFNDFYTDILPELRLTFNEDCVDNSECTTSTKHELTPASCFDCLKLNAVACADSLKKQFYEKAKEEYIRGMKSFIAKVIDIYTAILHELPANDPHEKGVQEFLNLLTADLPKLNTKIDLDYLNDMFNAMHNDLIPKFSDTKIGNESNELYKSLVAKHSTDKPSMEELNETKNLYINRIWHELVEDLHAVEFLKQLHRK